MKKHRFYVIFVLNSINESQISEGKSTNSEFLEYIPGHRITETADKKSANNFKQ